MTTPPSTLLQPIQAHIGVSLCIPFFDERVHAGFPSPAEDHQEESLDLTKRLIRHPSATFFVRAEGDSMEPGICSGDLLVVDRSRKPRHEDIVIAVIEGGFAVRRFVRLEREAGKLVSDNPRYVYRAIAEDENLQIWGVVSAVVREFT